MEHVAALADPLHGPVAKLPRACLRDQTKHPRRGVGEQAVLDTESAQVVAAGDNHGAEVVGAPHRGQQVLEGRIVGTQPGRFRMGVAARLEHRQELAEGIPRNAIFGEHPVPVVLVHPDLLRLRTALQHLGHLPLAQLVDNVGGGRGLGAYRKTAANGIAIAVGEGRVARGEGGRLLSVGIRAHAPALHRYRFLLPITAGAENGIAILDGGFLDDVDDGSRGRHTAGAPQHHAIAARCLPAGGEQQRAGAGDDSFEPAAPKRPPAQRRLHSSAGRLAALGATPGSATGCQPHARDATVGDGARGGTCKIWPGCSTALGGSPLAAASASTVVSCRRAMRHSESPATTR